MSSVELTAALQARIAELSRWLDEGRVLDREHRGIQLRLDDEAAAAWADLARRLLPALTPDALDEAAAALDLPVIAAEVVVAARDAERVRHETAAAVARGDPAFADAAAQRAQLTARARDLTAHAALLRESIRQLEQLKDFRELCDTRYGTPDDDVSWWTWTGMRRKAAADAIVLAVGKQRGARDFTKLRALWSNEREALVTYDGELADLRRAVADLDALVAQASEAARALATLDEDALRATRARIVDALAGLPEASWLALTDHVPAGRTAARAVAGLHAKRRYVDALFEHYVQRARGDVAGLAREYEALQEDLTGAPTFFARPTHTSQDVDRRADEALSSSDERLRTYRAVRGRILAFVHYASVDPTRDLWWDAMVGGAVDGSFVDEVTWHRATRGGPTAPIARARTAAPRPSSTPVHADTSTTTRAWGDAARRAEEHLAERLATAGPEEEAALQERAEDEATARGGPAPVDLPPPPKARVEDG